MILLQLKIFKTKICLLILFLQRNVGNDDSTSFWDDLWYGDISLKNHFPRVYALEVEKCCVVKDRVVNGDMGYLFEKGFGHCNGTGCKWLFNI